MLEEAKKINLSLTSLGLCIKNLTDGSAHVPFRDSKLTYFLKESLGGNSKTTLVCTASKQLVHLEESIQTLKFAQRAKKIKNKAVANALKSPAEMELLIKKLKAEVATLRSQLISSGIPPQMDKNALDDKSEQQITATTGSCPNCGTSLSGIEDGSKDVSFTTLLDDSNIVFDNVKVETTSKVESKIGMGTAAATKEQDSAKEAKLRKQAIADSNTIAELQMKLSEVESDFEYYKEKCELEIIEMKDKIAKSEENREDEDMLRAQITDCKYEVT